ncbi:hypothetical protein ACNKHO_20560 [Shigella flexneri]
MTNTPLRSGDSDWGAETSRISHSSLRQSDHFDLRDSEVSFITLSGQRAESALQSPGGTGKDVTAPRGGGIFQPDRDTALCRCGWICATTGLLNNGRVWLQADDVDGSRGSVSGFSTTRQPETVRFSLEGWMTP